MVFSNHRKTMIKRRARCLLVLALLLAAPGLAFAQTGVDGTWLVTLTTPQGPTAVDLVLTQDGEHVTAKLNTPLGAVVLKGTLVGSDIKSAAAIDFQGLKLDVALAAHVDGDALAGSVKLGSFGEFPFTGKRQPGAGASSSPTATTPATSDATTVAGQWAIVIRLGGALEFPMSATFTLDGDKVGGMLTSALSQAPVNGTMVGRTLTLAFTANLPTGEFPVTMSGDLDQGRLAGRATIVGVGDADWSGTRVQ
jgi:hypothetical protein